MMPNNQSCATENRTSHASFYLFDGLGSEVAYSSHALAPGQLGILHKLPPRLPDPSQVAPLKAGSHTSGQLPSPSSPFPPSHKLLAQAGVGVLALQDLHSTAQVTQQHSHFPPARPALHAQHSIERQVQKQKKSRGCHQSFLCMHCSHGWSATVQRQREG